MATADVLSRIQIGISVALSEMLADFMESRFARAVPEAALPTSSLIPVRRLKMDLSIGDMRRQILRLRRPYRMLATDPTTRDQLALQSTGLPGLGLLEAVEGAATLIWQRLAGAFDVTIDGQPVEPSATGVRCLRSSALRRILLQVVLVARELERGLEGAKNATWRDPETSPGLFMVGFTHIYEADRRRNFWHLDQIMRESWSPACAALMGCLREAVEAAGRGLHPEGDGTYDTAMTTPAELAPLFTDVALSSVEVDAIAAALRDIAESDGTHEAELAMIDELIAGMNAELGDEKPGTLEEMTPQKRAVRLGEDPTLKTLAMQCGILLAVADGKTSSEERQRLDAYAEALGISGDDYKRLEDTIVGWVQSGDSEPLFS